MAQFDFNAYMARERAAGQSTPKTSPVYKVGYFKLANDGDTAIVRFNYESAATIHFATVHTVKTKDGKYKKVSCLREKWEDPKEMCPLCMSTDEQVSKISTKTYITLLDYVKQEDGTMKAMPKVWERPSGFAKELAQLITDFGNLKECLFKITRQNGATSSDVRYIITYCRPEVYTPENFPADFSDFEDYDLTKHGYYVKTAEEMEAFVKTGDFPMRAKQEVAEPIKAETTVAKITPTPAATPVKETVTAAPAAQPSPMAETGFGFTAAPTRPAPVAQPAPAAAPTGTTGTRPVYKY